MQAVRDAGPNLQGDQREASEKMAAVYQEQQKSCRLNNNEFASAIRHKDQQQQIIESSVGEIILQAEDFRKVAQKEILVEIPEVQQNASDGNMFPAEKNEHNSLARPSSLTLPSASSRSQLALSSNNTTSFSLNSVIFSPSNLSSRCIESNISMSQSVSNLQSSLSTMASSAQPIVVNSVSSSFAVTQAVDSITKSSYIRSSSPSFMYPDEPKKVHNMPVELTPKLTTTPSSAVAENSTTYDDQNKNSTDTISSNSQNSSVGMDMPNIRGEIILPRTERQINKQNNFANVGFSPDGENHPTITIDEGGRVLLTSYHKNISDNRKVSWMTMNYFMLLFNVNSILL